MEVKLVRLAPDAPTIRKLASGLVWYYIRAYNLICYFDVCLGAFTKLRKATISFVKSVCPFTWNNSAHTGRIFMIFYIRALFENLPETSTIVKI